MSSGVYDPFERTLVKNRVKLVGPWAKAKDEETCLLISGDALCHF